MKKILSLIFCVSIFISCFSISSTTVNGDTNNSGDFTQSPQNFVQNIVAGWNLGNTLESCHSWGNIPESPTPTEQETGWNNPVTTQAMIDFVSRAGFNAIRIPVTWGLQLNESNGVYTIKSDWMSRVKKVVRYAQNNNMYIIVNMHHDDRDWLNISVSDSEWAKVKEKYRQLWVQIADAFKDYDEKLILEGANEIIATPSFDDCDTSGNECWWGHSDTVFERQNELYQIFVDTVRDSGGNNYKRYLMLPTYGAQWYENQIKKLIIPNNDSHIIMDIHWYKGSTTNADSNKKVFNLIKNYCDNRNIGAVIGECGFNKNTSNTTKTNWANNFIKPAKQLGISCFLWDDGGDMAILNRKNSPLSWNSTAYVEAVINAANNAIVPGDINGDGKFNAIDMLFAARYLTNRPGFLSASNAADINKDGKIDLVDYLYIRKLLAGIITVDDIK